jgi:hypothetical protein
MNDPKHALYPNGLSKLPPEKKLLVVITARHPHKQNLSGAASWREQ